jgi:hypothetical protein
MHIFLQKYFRLLIVPFFYLTSSACSFNQPHIYFGVGLLPVPGYFHMIELFSKNVASRFLRGFFKYSVEVHAQDWQRILSGKENTRVRLRKK